MDVVGLKSYCTVVEILCDCMFWALGLFLTHKQCVVVKEQMPAVQTELMFHWQLGDRIGVSLTVGRQNWGFIDRWATELGFH